MSNMPSEGELSERIQEHLAASPDDREVPVMWQGYLAALIEWGLISVDAHARLSALLGGAGADAVRDALLNH
jgi:hypothetical protein